MTPPTTTPTTPLETSTTPPPIPIDLSNVSLLNTYYGINIIDENGISVLEEEFDRLDDIFADENGHIWATDFYGLYEFDGQYWIEHELPEGVYSVYTIATDSNGRVWIGYYEGISVLDNGQWTSYSSDLFGLGTFSDLINDIAIDHQDRVWVATSSGVAVYDGQSWVSYDEASGLNDESIEAILVDHQGRIWIAHSRGVEVFDGNNWAYYGDDYSAQPPHKVDNLDQAEALAEDNQGNIWAGTYSNGIFVFNGSSWKNYDSKEYLLNSSVRSMAADNWGRIWVGIDLGLTVFDGYNWFHYTKHSSGLLVNHVNSIVVTGNGPSSLPQAPPLGFGSVKGSVTRGGQPLAGARVVVCWETSMFYSGDSPCSGDSYSANTDANGEFLITGVPTYCYHVAIQLPEGDWKILLSDIIVDGEENDMGVIKVT